MKAAQAAAQAAAMPKHADNGATGADAAAGAPGEKGPSRDTPPKDGSGDPARPRSKEPWRPSRPYPLKTSSLSPSPKMAERRHSAERRFSAERRSSAERRGSADRRHSLDRLRSMRTSSVERGFRSLPQRSKSVGPTAFRRSGSIVVERDRERDHRPDRNQGVQLSEFWMHKLPNGNPVQVWIIADHGHLNQAAYRLNFLRPETVAAVDFQGVNLQSGGKLSLCLVVFHDGVCLNCFVFDLLQLGEHFRALMPFLQNNTVSKLIFDVPTHAKLCAQQFGITLAGVFHAQSAYELLVGTSANSLIDLLEWCGTAPPQARAEATMMERAPGLWAHRPLAQETIINGVHSISFLHAAGHVLWTRLCKFGGQQSAHTVTQTSQQRVQAAAAAGLQLRNQGIQAGTNVDDPELDTWLARRFGKGSPPEDMPRPENIIRAGDSPRTASWRATVAQMHPNRSKSRGPSQSRQRSESPSLDTWIQQRNQIKGTDEGGPTEPKAHRASSLPPKRSPDAVQTASDREFKPNSPMLDAANLHLSYEQLESLKGDGRTWADVLEEEQNTQGQNTQEEEKDADEELFNQLRQVDARRQSEFS